jgi:DNA-directed RNA polymerase specialized sigma24 family protein
VRRLDPIQELAEVARARRDLLLRAHRFRLRPEDLEDCYSQATLELLTQAKSGRAFSSRAHIANALEQRFLSRIHDRRRAISGRSPMLAALESAIPLINAAEQPIEVIDLRAELETLVVLREDLRRLTLIARRLTPDQRLVLASQIAQTNCAEFCRRTGWSAEKYRKVAQRARARLRRLMREERGVPLPPTASDGVTGTRP